MDRLTVEVHRSREILERKERNARTKDETALVSEEKTRLGGYEAELRSELRKALLNGAAFFRGNARDPDNAASGAGQAAATLLSQALPEVYDRFADGAANVTNKDLDALLATDNLRGLPTWTFTSFPQGPVGLGVTGGEAAFKDVRVRILR